MRIALVTPGFSVHPGDWAIPALQNLARELARQHEVHIFSQRYPAKGTYQFDGLTLTAVGGGQNFGPASARIWQQTAQTIIHQHHHTPFDLLHAFWADEAGLSATLAGHWLKRPVVVSLGGGELTYLPDINYGGQRFMARRLTTWYALKQASLVTAGSAYQLDLCRAHGVSASKLRLAPLGVDTHRFQPINLAFSPPTLVQAASLLPVKNQPLLLHVLGLVKRKIPQIRLNLAGAGPLQDELMKLAQKLDLGQHLVWRQQLEYPLMPLLYRQSHLYLQTSRHEAQGLAVLEAMACGLPVLGTPVGVVPEVACLVPHTSPEILAEQVVEILNDMTRYLELRRQARQRVKSGYSLPVTVTNFLQIYRALIT